MQEGFPPTRVWHSAAARRIPAVAARQHRAEWGMIARAMLDGAAPSAAQPEVHRPAAHAWWRATATPPGDHGPPNPPRSDPGQGSPNPTRTAPAQDLAN